MIAGGLIRSMVGGLLCGVTQLIAGSAIRWVGCEPSLRQRIYFANHSSHLDTLVVWAALPPDVRQTLHPVAAHDFWSASPLRRYLAEDIFQAVLIVRPDHVDPAELPPQGSPLETMLEALGTDQSLLIFPEGTRGTGESIAPLKSGLYHLARSRPDAEIVPVFLDNLNRILPKGEILPVPFLGSVSFGAPLPPAGDLDKAEYLNLAHESLHQLGAETS